MHNNSITTNIRPVLIKLDRYIREPEVFKLVLAYSKKAVAQISSTLPYTSIAIGRKQLVHNPPKEIGSLRVAAFVPNEITKIERHPNSTQFLFSLSGHGETEVLWNGVWKKDQYGVGIKNTYLETYWHVVEQNIWHRSVAKGRDPWVLLAIHTALNVMDDYQFT